MSPRTANIHKLYYRRTGTGDICLLGRAFDRQIRRYGRAFEHNSRPWVGRGGGI